MKEKCVRLVRSIFLNLQKENPEEINVLYRCKLVHTVVQHLLLSVSLQGFGRERFGMGEEVAVSVLKCVMDCLVFVVLGTWQPLLRIPQVMRW